MLRRLTIAAIAIAIAVPPAWAMRLVSLAPSATETLFALGAGPDVVGVSAYCDYPAEAAGIDRVGTFLTPNIEAIVAKRPDLVIVVPSPGNRDSVGVIASAGLRVLAVDPRAVDEIVASVERIGAAVGRGEAGRRLAAAMRDEIAATRRRLDGAPEVKVLMVVGQTPLIAVGGDVYQDEMIRMAGGRNVAAKTGGQWPHLSIEFVLAQAPEVIVDTTLANEGRAGMSDAGGFWAGFTTLPAVRDRRVFAYRDDALLRPGPRVAQGLRALARMIHPERFRETLRDE